MMDDECDSRVCDRGRCVDEAAILYVAPDGMTTANCRQSTPCSFDRAFDLALQTSPQPVVRLLPGTYNDGVAVDVAMATPLEIVGTGATLNGVEGGLRVSSGGNAVVRGVVVTGDSFALTCGDASGIESTLTLSDSVLRQGTSATTVLNSGNCRLTVTAVDLQTMPTGTDSVGAISIGGGTTFVGDRLHVHGVRTQVFFVVGSRISVAITNSIFENVSLGWSTFDSQAPGTRLNFAFNTFVLADYSSVNCEANSGSSHRMVRFENNIIVGGKTTPEVVINNDCSTYNNVLDPQTTRANNILASPQFVDQEGRDYHLLPSSPAIGAATSATALPTDHDFAGSPRPSSAADIGAYEQ